MSSGGASLSTSHRVVVRIHDDTTVVRPAAQPAATSRLSMRLKIMIGVADCSDRGAAGGEDHPGLARGETEDSVLAFTGGQLRESGMNVRVESSEFENGVDIMIRVTQK